MVNQEDFSKNIDYLVVDDDDDVPLPGFRFHPTDEELVSFYLRRKLDKKPISIELIKQIDIYKYDPWDLPKASCTGGEKEWYFFCRRGRKYRNSIRPNRVTGSGFWKATGIDKPVYSLGGEGSDCIGLKKTLVYYRGSAGKGTKTDWMMHEFRLPSNNDTTSTNLANAKDHNTSPAQLEAEIWTLCRIFKRNVTQRKYGQDWRQITGVKRHANVDKITRTSSVESNTQEAYISFSSPSRYVHQHNYNEQNPVINYTNVNDQRNQFHAGQLISSSPVGQPQMLSASNTASSFLMNSVSDDFFKFDQNWDELASVVKFAF
ncbi:hypothetical protein L6164_022812 [Bauhinia variegata]|uniref:Uncharacterized protein n=1 Tax=Bauhinia variegata TaxID=167791 RepID=A0ACB9MGC5_BAUVA|nr:hypothetical protein L6164_022812 [Bauhinia variegata]